MAWLAQRLPVVPVPEQSVIATVRRDVIHDQRGLDAARLHASHAQRLLQKPDCPCFAPFRRVTALMSAASGLSVVRFGLLSVLLTPAMLCEGRTARVGTWSRRFYGHIK